MTPLANKQLKMELKEAIEKAQLYVDRYNPVEYDKAIQTLIDHAKKSMKSLEGEALVGREVKVIKCLHGHEFEIGEIVTITSWMGDDKLLEYKANNSWWLSRSEFEVID